jgi:hypothetical protein
MSDVGLKDEIARLIKSDCTLRLVLKSGKPCPFFGNTGTCGSCTHAWYMLASVVLKVVNRRGMWHRKRKRRRKVSVEELEHLKTLEEARYSERNY